MFHLLENGLCRSDNQLLKSGTLCPVPPERPEDPAQLHDPTPVPS